MHFFYIDESGDTGRDLTNVDQPVMIMGGVSLSDEKWNSTHQAFSDLLSKYFNGSIPANFELHAIDLLSPNGTGAFANHPMPQRCQLVKDVLGILETNSHNVHLIGFNKHTMHATPLGQVLAFNPKRPYLLGFDYLITYINWFIKENLGSSARGLMILDQKQQHQQDIERIMHDRRFVTTATHRVKRIVEYGYPVDSRKNAMIQFSDVIIYCVKRFYEIEHGFRNTWNQNAKDFYAQCYDIIDSRIVRKALAERGERQMTALNEYISTVRVTHSRNWRTKYTL